MPGEKPTDTIVLDAGPIIRNDPVVSSLLAQASTLVTIPAVVNEIRDANTRSRIETLLKPFLTLREPRAGSIKVVSEFARRTGDLPVLSRTDLQVLALAYDVECEKNGGDWRLRSAPGQKGTNGPAPDSEKGTETAVDKLERETNDTKDSNEDGGSDAKPAEEKATERPEPTEEQLKQIGDVLEGTSVSSVRQARIITRDEEETQKALDNLMLPDGLAPEDAFSPDLESIDKEEASSDHEHPNETEEFADGDSDSDASEGWITPSNINKHKAKDAKAASATDKPDPHAMRVATMTTDYAMQNVLLQMNLTLLSTSFQRIRHIRTYALRCHACFYICKEMGKQFCPRCGQATLQRVTCSTDAKGQFQVHLSKKFQWNNRGNRYSVPKPTAGASNPRKVHGGGKGGWGRDLILAEDQKEFIRATQQEKRTKQKDLMDPDYLPSILTGERGKQGGRPKVGAGRNVNSRKR